MSFLSPLGLALAGLLLPLVFLYLLRVQRREQPVPSLLLWAAPLRDQQATAFLGRLRRDPLLILQVLALLLLALALARPVVPIMGEGDRKVVVVLDASSSMKATDVSPSRFEAARGEAARLVRGLGPGAEIMVVEAGIQPRVLVPLTRDRDTALAAIRRAEATDGPVRLVDALRIARALLGADERGEVHVFTDGAFTLAETADTTDPRLRWTGVGRRGHNAAVTALSVRKSYRGPSDYEAFVTIANHAAEPLPAGLVLEIDGHRLAERSAVLAPGVRRSIVVPFTHTAGGVVTARIDVRDDLVTDNVARAVLPPPARTAVSLVSPGNLFLETALRSDPYVELTVTTPEAYGGGMGTADVVVLDSVPVPQVGAGRFVLVNTVPDDVPLQVLGRLERPRIVEWDREHPVMRHVELTRVVVEDALLVRPVGTGRGLVQTSRGPLVSTLEEPDRRAVFVGFDLFKTDLPLRVAFPILLSNSLRWLHPDVLDRASVDLPAGSPLELAVDPRLVDATVTSPTGRATSVAVRGGRLRYGDTAEAGLYTVETGRGSVLVAVNVSPEEGDLTPRPLPEPAAPAAPAGARVPVDRELWPLLVLVAAALLALEGALYCRRQTGGRLRPPSGAADRLALALRCVLLVVLCAALLRPSVPRWADRLNVAFLLDHSDSVSLAARERLYRFVADAVQHRKSDDRHSVIVFGADAAIDQSLARWTEVERPTAAVEGGATNLFQALQLALATLPAGQAGRVVMLTDGRENAGNAAAAAQAARDAGVELSFVPAPLTLTQEVVAESLTVPEEVKFGESFDARVVVWSQQEAQGRLSLFRNGEFVGAQIVRLQPGRNVFAYRQSVETSGIHVYQASIEVESDTIVENNRAVGAVAVRGKPRVLVADKDPGLAGSFVRALRSQNLDVTLVGPARIPKTLAALQQYDGIVLSNVSALHLSTSQMANIREYVRDHGGGLMMLGGEESFGLGGYHRTPIEEALPVTMDVRQRVDVPSLAVTISIDRSGSMAQVTDGRHSRMDLAKEAAHLVVDMLDPRNEVGVQTWDTEFAWDVPLGPARDKSSIHHAIASIRPGGGTDGYPALLDAYKRLIPNPALLKHIIFIGDGEMPGERYRELLRRMAREKITVSTVAIGKEADVRLMVDIARWGRGRFYYTESAEHMPRILTLETQLAAEASLVERPFTPQLTAPGHEAVQDIDWKRVPPLGGYVATTIKNTADLVLMSPREEPVLAAWRYGLGRTVAFTSDAKSKWAAVWLRWPEFGKFWAQVTRWTLRPGARSDLTATVRRVDETGEVIVDAIDPGGEFVNFLESQVGVVTPDRERTVLDLEQVGPGRYRARFPAEQEGVYLLGLAQRKEDETVGSRLFSLVVPYARELRELGVDEAALHELAAMTGGAALQEPRDVFHTGRRPSRVAVEIWPWLVVAAGILLLPDVALRRVGPALLRRLRRRAVDGARTQA